MCSKNFSFATALLVILQVHETISCTFIDQKDDFVADVIYAMLKKDKDWCLLTCYEEANCTYVEYQEGVCTIFEDGETHQDGGISMYKLDCQLTLPACPHCLPLAPEVEFQTLPMPKMKQSKARMRELLAKNASAFTVVHMYKKNGYIFTKSEAAFPDGTAPFRRLEKGTGARELSTHTLDVSIHATILLRNNIGEETPAKLMINRKVVNEANTVCLKSIGATDESSPGCWKLEKGSRSFIEARRSLSFSLVFAKNPQPECVSVPVFQKADQHKLYFGDIYNVTGYEFLDAYAFTTYCACEGTCCGQVKLESKLESRFLSIRKLGWILDYAISDANQTLYIANVRGSDNSSWAKPKSTICFDYL